MTHSASATAAGAEVNRAAVDQVWASPASPKLIANRFGVIRRGAGLVAAGVGVFEGRSSSALVIPTTVLASGGVQ